MINWLIKSEYILLYKIFHPLTKVIDSFIFIYFFSILDLTGESN